MSEAELPRRKYDARVCQVHNPERGYETASMD